MYNSTNFTALENVACSVDNLRPNTNYSLITTGVYGAVTINQIILPSNPPTDDSMPTIVLTECELMFLGNRNVYLIDSFKLRSRHEMIVRLFVKINFTFSAGVPDPPQIGLSVNSDTIMWDTPSANGRDIIMYRLFFSELSGYVESLEKEGGRERRNERILTY